MSQNREDAMKKAKKKTRVAPGVTMTVRKTRTGTRITLRSGKNGPDLRDVVPDLLAPAPDLLTPEKP